MGPIADIITSSVGDTIAVEIGLHVGFDIANKVISVGRALQCSLLHDSQAVADGALTGLSNFALGTHSAILETTVVKSILITLQHHTTVTDAALGTQLPAFGNEHSNTYDQVSTEARFTRTSTCSRL